MDENNHPRWTEKLKDHLKTNKKTYLISAGTAAIGAIAGGMIVYSRMGYAPVEQFMAANNIAKFGNGVFWKPFLSQTVETNIGRPSYIVHDVTKDIWYRSQGAAAFANDVRQSNMTEYFKGARPDIKGSQFERYAIMK